MKKSLDPRDIYWSYRIENFPADIDDAALSFDLNLIGLDGWELVSLTEYQALIDVPEVYILPPHTPDQKIKTFVKYIFKKPELSTDYNDER